MDAPSAPYYRSNLALVHHRGFGFHADNCADDILEILEPVRRRGGLVLELGCGSGRLTRHLVDAGHRVLATDASPAMVALARAEVPDAVAVTRLALPDDPLPPADAIVSVGHVLNYLADETAIKRAVTRVGQALRPDGVVAVDVCDLRWGEARRDQPDFAAVEDDWAVFTRYVQPAPATFVREITTFVRDAAGSWSRDDERHVNVLIDTAEVPAWLAPHGVVSTIAPAFGRHVLADGLVAVVGRKMPA